MQGAQCSQFLMVIFVLMKLSIFALFLVHNVEIIPYKNEKVAARLQLGCCYYAAIKYCRFGNVRENLIFANIREFVASRIQSSRLY